MRLVRWPTLVSDYKSLYFKRLIDDGDGRFILKTDTKDIYEVLLDGYCGPYLISDEGFLTKYWAIKPNDVGWTFIVDSSDFTCLFPEIVGTGNYKHYVVSTMDTCLSVLSEREPRIREVKRSE